jgi:cytochrome P460
VLARPGQGRGVGTRDPQYAKGGSMVLPSLYRGWRFVTSGLGMTYGPTGTADAEGHPNFDNVFASPAAYTSFEQTGTWPDKTVLVLEVRASDSTVSINKGGYVQTKLVRVEAHVKDAARGGWGFYVFEPGVTEATLLPKTAKCYSCHEQHGAVDSTFVQFYPTLIQTAIGKGTYRAATQDDKP